MPVKVIKAIRIPGQENAARFCKILACAGAGFFLTSVFDLSPVLAQEQTGILEEVIVTAQKREQDINDVGITINVFTGELIRDLGVRSAEDLAKYTPGLNVNETTIAGAPVYTLRGVGFQDFYAGASSTVGLYFDGVNMPYSVMSRGALFDVERVEVLRGPQGDLYGRNTTAGQINFISRKPTEEFEAGVTLGFSSYETLDAEGFVSGPLSDRARGRLAFRTTQSWEGWQKSLTRDDKLGEKDVYALRAILDTDITDNARLEVKVGYIKDNSDNQAPQAINGLDIGDVQVGRQGYIPLQHYTHQRIPVVTELHSIPPWFASDDATEADWSTTWTSPITGILYDFTPKRDNELISASARLEWEFNGVTLTSLTAYDRFEREEANDGDGCACNDTSNINTTDLDVFSQELILSGATDRFTWLAGGYYSDDNLDENYDFFMPDSTGGNASLVFNRPPFFLAPILQLDTISEQDTESWALFGHVEWSITEQFRLILGARYTEEERSWTGCTASSVDNSWGHFGNVLFGTSLGPGDCLTIDDDPESPTFFFNVAGTPNVDDAFHIISDKIKAEKWMWKAGLDFQVNDNVLLYGSASHGFKSGGFNGAISNAATSLRPYRPEELTAYEGGAKMTLMDGKMQLNVNGFYYDYKDKQEVGTAVSPVGNLFGFTNVEESEIYGAELELDWIPVAGLNIHFGVNWLETEVTEWNAVDTQLSRWPTVVTRDASGVELPQAPEWSYNGVINYRRPFLSDMYIEIGGDVSYTDSTSGGNIGVVTATEDYAIFNVRGGVGTADEKWKVQVWSRNVTDKFYFPSRLTANGPRVRMAGMPRTVGVTVSYNF